MDYLTWKITSNNKSVVEAWIRERHLQRKRKPVAHEFPILRFDELLKGDPFAAETDNRDPEIGR
jgi:hypothetical protein